MKQRQWGKCGNSNKCGESGVWSRIQERTKQGVGRLEDGESVLRRGLRESQACVTVRGLRESQACVTVNRAKPV